MVLGIAALAAWVLTALGGFVLLGRWVARGGLRQQRGGATRFPAGLVFSHFVLAAAGLVVWIVYLVVDYDPLTWVALGLLVVIALLGFAMFSRWLPVYRGQTLTPAGGPGTTRPATGSAEPAERHLPVPVVVGHGVLAVATLILVLLTALGLGAS